MKASKSLACSKFAATTRPEDFALPEQPRSRKGDDIVTVPDDGKRTFLHQRTMKRIALGAESRTIERFDCRKGV